MYAYGVFLRSLRDLIRWSVLREVLITGLPLLLIWIGIGWIIWEPLLKFTTHIISWVPFSMVKANGALLILFLLWGVAVLISYSFVTAIIAPLFFRRMKRGYYYYSFTTLLIFGAGWAWYILTHWGVFKSTIADKLLTWLPFQTVAEGSAILLNFYILYSFYILTLFLVLSMFRRPFLNTILDIDYPEAVINAKDIETGHAFITLRDTLIFIALSILLFPLLFIPIINVLIQLFLWAWLYRDTNFRATCRIYCQEEDFNRLKEHKFTIWSIAFFASILNFVPIINMFTPFFAQLIIFHWIMGQRDITALDSSIKREGYNG